jgi:predicted hydrocarbon binding protein
LGNILQRPVYVHGRFARPEAPSQDARLGVLHILDGHRRRQAASETEMAGRDLGHAMSEGEASQDALAKLEASQKQQGESDRRYFEIDRVDEPEG